MPKIRANNITMNYEQQGSGEPLLLIPYLAADNACYAFNWPTMPSNSTASRSIRAARGKLTNHREPIRPNFLRTTLLAFLARSASSARMIAG